MKSPSKLLRDMFEMCPVRALLLGAIFLAYPVPFAEAEQCQGPLFLDTVSPGCKKKIIASEQGIFNLYSTFESQLRESAPEGIKLKSSNRVLSFNGPQAPAELWLRCSILDNAELTLTFPGYPMFIQNEEIAASVLSGNKQVLNFSAMRGDDLFQLRIDSKKVLKQFAKLLFQSGNQQFTVTSVDQDGLEVRAVFEPPADVQMKRQFAHYCLGLV